MLKVRLWGFQAFGFRYRRGGSTLGFLVRVQDIGLGRSRGALLNNYIYIYISIIITRFREFGVLGSRPLLYENPNRT